MIYDVGNTIETQAADGAAGLNAMITAVNADKGTTVPALQTVQLWGPSDGTPAQLPFEMPKPLLVIAWDGSNGVDLVSQGKRRPNHDLKLYYLDDEPDQQKARMNAAIMQTALMRFLDGLPGQGTIQEIGPVRFKPKNWLTAGREHHATGWEATFTLKERDENP